MMRSKMMAAGGMAKKGARGFDTPAEREAERARIAAAGKGARGSDTPAERDPKKKATKKAAGGMMKKGYAAGGMATKGGAAGGKSKVRGAGVAIKGTRPAKMM
jgi:hypothetical protein